MPTAVRPEGLTELLGDVVALCSGGSAGSVRTVDLSLSLAVPLTSRVIAGKSEALLITDDDASSAISAEPVAGQSNAVIWRSVNIIEPGPGIRVLRFTNIRANVTGLTSPGPGLPAQVRATLSAPAGLSLDTPEQTPSYVSEATVSLDVATCNGVDPQTTTVQLASCQGANASGSADLVSGTSGNMQFSLRFREQYQLHFRPQLTAFQIPSLPGAVYPSESGFIPSSANFATGGANTGTRLQARFNNIPAGARIFVTTGASFGSTSGVQAVLVQDGTQPEPAGAPVPRTPTAIAGTRTLRCTLSGGAGQAAAEIPVINGHAVAVWEVTESTIQLDTLVFGVAVAYPAVQPAQAVAAQASVTGGLAPGYSAASGAGSASSTLPIPRFVEPTTNLAAFETTVCGALLSLSKTTGPRGTPIDAVISAAGTNFLAGPVTVSLGPGITVSTATPASATTLAIRFTVDSGAAAGARDLIVNANGNILTLAGAFTVLGPTTEPFTCRSSAGVPPLLRAEGYTELTGEILIVCTGGTSGALRNFNLQLFLNTQITSRILDSGTEALLLVDDQVSYRAQRASGTETSIVWSGVSLQEPGAGQRTLRIVNVRANAAGLSTSGGGLPPQLIAFLAASPQQSLPLDKSQLVIGYVQPGVLFDLRSCNGADAQSSPLALRTCLSHNASGSNDLINGSAGTMQFAVRYREGFQTAFKPQLAPGQNPSTPGVSYHAESGFILPASGFLVGGASTGTRLIAQFNNIPAGARIFVTTSPSFGSSPGLQAVLTQTSRFPLSASPAPNVPSGPIGSVTLRCAAAGSTGQPAIELPVAGGEATAVWEIINASPTELDTVVFGVGVALPQQGSGASAQSSVSGGLAPAFAANTGAAIASSSLPLPRFAEPTTVLQSFRTAPCTTSLLFPFVVSTSGFDTGIAITNTSRDPFPNPGERMQSGRCTLNFYGSTDSGAQTPPQTTASPIAPGETVTMVLSSGGTSGLKGVPGFTGYLIAQCDFLYAHGFSFLTDGPSGLARVAEGYLALVLDGADAPRSQSFAESQAH